MKNANPASLADRVRLLLEIARLRRAGLRVWLVATERGLKLLTDEETPCNT